MQISRSLAYLALGLAIALNVAGHLLFKAGALRSTTLAGTYLDFWVLWGVAAYGGSAIFYIAALRALPLTIAMPSMAIGYVVAGAAASYMWNERFGMKELAALALITLGLFVLNKE